MCQKLKVLIAEDELLIRMLLSESFEDAGWEVTTAESGEEAVLLLDGFDAIVTDIEMPGSVDGVQLSWIARTRTPNVPIVIMSGRVVPRKASLPPDTHFLAKPVPHDVLLHLVRDLVRGSG